MSPQTPDALADTQPGPISLAVARAVRRERAGLSLTQAALADRLGVSRATLGAWESGSRVLSLPQVVTLCRVLCVPLSVLLAGDEIEVADARRVLGCD